MLTATASILIGLLHWNPHWQCFGNTTCSVGATKALNDLLTSTAAPVDFANLIELEDETYSPPTGWNAVGHNESCGDPYGDWDTIYYNSNRWELVKSANGCLTPARSYAAGVFQLRAQKKKHEKGNLAPVTIFGAHFPQTLNASTHAYTDATVAVQSKLQSLGWSRTDSTIFMADTNTEGPAAAAANVSHHGVNKTNGQLFSDIGVWPAATASQDPPGATLFNSCCYSDAFSWQGDRVLSNFGTVVKQTPLFDPTPAWADFAGNEMHRGIYVSLQV